VRQHTAIAGLVVALPSLGFAASQKISILGGPLSPGAPGGAHLPGRSIDPCRTDQTRDHFVVFGLPAHWSAGAGQCHTAALGNYRKLAFTFADGIATVSSLKAQGYAFTNGEDGLPPAPTLTLCRDAQGGIESVNVQISMIKDTGSGIFLFEVTAANSSPIAGSSQAAFAGVAGGNGVTCSSSSSAANKVEVTN